MSKIRVQEIEHTASSNTNPAIALNANNNVTFDAGVTATSFTGDGANLTNVPAPSTFNAANLTGTLPAIDGSALTGISLVAPTGGTFTGSVSFEDAINETVYALTGASATLDPDNGMIQTWTLSGTSTATDALTDGQSMLLLVTAGANSLAFSSTPAIKWAGGSQPALSATDVTAIELFKVGTQLYGAGVGDLS